MFRTRRSPLDAHLPLLDEQWTSGCRNGAELWRRLMAHGFRGSLRVEAEWAKRLRRAEKATDQQLQRVSSARTIAHLMTTARNHLSKADTVTIAAIERGVPVLVEIRSPPDPFNAMIRCKGAVPNSWSSDAATSLMASFDRHQQGQGGSCGGHRELMVKRADHPAQAREAPDVRARQD